MAAKKKSPIDLSNPALSFISKIDLNDDLPDESEQTVLTEVIDHEPDKRRSVADHGGAEPNAAPAGYRINPEYIEMRTKRLQLVLPPSLYEAMKAKAKASKLSVNEYCNRLIEADLRGE